MNTKTITFIGLMAAIICVIGPFSIPIPVSPVPIALTNLAIYFTIYILGMKWGTMSVLIYLLIGLAGLPVFSNFSGGLAKLAGPTGGYLIGYVFMALISGFFIDRWASSMWISFLGLILSTAACYLFGTVWLAHQANLSFSAALAAGVIPFIPGDLAKILIGLLIGSQLRKRIRPELLKN